MESLSLYIIGLLAAFNVMQAFWISRLIDKLMSRNYYDYKVTSQLQLDKKEATIKENQVIDEPMEDLGYLGGMA